MGKPTIRFEGYTDDWEQRKFGEIVEKYEDPVETPTEGYTRLGIRSHAKGTFHSYVEKGKELETAKMFRVAADKFIVNITFGWEHAVAITDENDAGKLVSHRFPQYSFNAGMEPKFFRYLILDENFKHHLELSSPGGAGRNRVLKLSDMLQYKMNFPSEAEQKKIAAYFDDLDHLITLHQRKCEETKKLKKFMLQKMFPKKGEKVPEIRFGSFTDDWEQRKLDDVVEFLDTMRKPLEGAKRISGPYPYYGASGIVDYVDGYLFDEELILLSEDGANITDRNYPVCFLASGKYWVNNHAHVLRTKQGNENNFICNSLERKDYTQYNTGMAMPKLNKETCKKIPILCPGFEEQKKIGDYFRSLDNLITLHQRKRNNLKNILKYIEITLIITKEAAKMPELEKIIEEKLIDQLIYGDSQWTYRKDLKTEEDLWKNFKYILEQNNKDRLNGESLSESEFEQVKNQLQFSSFYKAGEWLVGENGKVQVHVQRDTERLHLVVMNHEHIAGGSSVYEVINQYSALKNEEDDTLPARDRQTV